MVAVVFVIVVDEVVKVVDTLLSVGNARGDGDGEGIGDACGEASGDGNLDCVVVDAEGVAGGLTDGAAVGGYVLRRACDT